MRPVVLIANETRLYSTVAMCKGAPLGANGGKFNAVASITTEWASHVEEMNLHTYSSLVIHSLQH